MKPYVLIVEGLDKTLLKSVEKKDHKEISTLLNEIKNNKDLKLLYKVVSNLKSTSNLNPKIIKEFIDNNIDFVKDINLSKYDNLTKKLKSFKLFEKNPILEDINTILFESITPFTVDRYLNSYKKVEEHLYELNTWKSKATDTLKDLNEQYEGLESEEDKKLFESFVKSKDKEVFVKSYMKDSINEIQKFIESVDTNEDKLALYKLKDALFNTGINENNLIVTLSEVHQLKKDLITENKK